MTSPARATPATPAALPAAGSLVRSVGRRRVRRLTVLAVVAAGSLVLGGCADGTPSGGRTVTVRPTVVVTPSSTPSPSSTTERVVPPTTYAEGLAHLSSGAPDAAAPTAFTSPTGNIVCTIVAGSAVRGCELRTGRIAAPTPSFCAGAGGGATDIGRVRFDANGPVAVCNKDAIKAPEAPVLSYGSTTRSGSVGCISETIGMTCVDASSGKGFFLARDTFFIF